MHRAAFLVLPLLLLAACETPRESCINQGLREIRTLDGLIATTRGNIQRGYGIETRQEVRVTSDICTARAEDGTETTFRCEDTDVFDVEVPVAVDLAAEGVKLDQLLARRAELAETQAARAAQCTSLYPE